MENYSGNYYRGHNEDDNRKLSLKKKKKKKIGNFNSSQPKRNSFDVYQTRSGS